MGARIWELCDGTRTIDEIATALADEYEAPFEVIRADTLDLLRELEREGLGAAVEG